MPWWRYGPARAADGPSPDEHGREGLDPLPLPLAGRSSRASRSVIARVHQAQRPLLPAAFLARAPREVRPARLARAADGAHPRAEHRNAGLELRQPRLLSDLEAARPPEPP